MLTFIDIFYSLQSFAVAAMFQMLMDDGRPLEKYRRWLDKKAFEWQNGWIAKPLGLCARCFHGQVGLWSGFFIYGVYFQHEPFLLALKITIFTAFNFLFFEIWSKTLNR